MRCMSTVVHSSNSICINRVYVETRTSTHTCFVTSKGPNLIVIPSVLVDVMMARANDGFSKLASLSNLAG